MNPRIDALRKEVSGYHAELHKLSTEIWQLNTDSASPWGDWLTGSAMRILTLMGCAYKQLQDLENAA